MIYDSAVSLLEKEMEVIGHEAIGKQFYLPKEIFWWFGDTFKGCSFQGKGFKFLLDFFGGKKRLFETIEEHLVIIFMRKNSSFFYTSVIYVVDSIRNKYFYSIFLWHGLTIPLKEQPCKWHTFKGCSLQGVYSNLNAHVISH